jgi:hypothetical protein
MIVFSPSAAVVGQVVNLRRIANPPAGSGIRLEAVRYAPTRRIANPPQDTILPHKAT